MAFKYKMTVVSDGYNNNLRVRLGGTNLEDNVYALPVLVRDKLIGMANTHNRGYVDLEISFLLGFSRPDLLQLPENVQEEFRDRFSVKKLAKYKPQASKNADSLKYIFSPIEENRRLMVMDSSIADNFYNANMVMPAPCIVSNYTPKEHYLDATFSLYANGELAIKSLNFLIEGDNISF